MSKKALLAIDQGTTSSRAILFTPGGDILALKQKELKLHYPRKGWVEQDPEDIWQDTLWAVKAAIGDARKKKIAIAGIGITNQRETTILWNRKTGRPLYNAIVWQDRRTADLCAKLQKQGFEKTIAERTGLVIDPYFSATKIAWILDHVKGARKAAEQGDLAFGTIDSFLLWRLTGGRVHATDVTNASRTMLYNIKTQKWDQKLLDIFGIPRALLPQVQENVFLFGHTDPAIVKERIAICGMAGDQQAALIGQGCFKTGMVKSTYGTGCFALINIGPRFKKSKNRLLTTIAYKINGQTAYAVEGSIFVAGAAVQWLRDGLGLFAKAQESERLALSVKDSNEVYFVPAFTGLGAPYWQPEARAMISGLSRESTAAHIVRAALEAQAYQTLDLMRAMEKDSGTAPAVIRADGGLVNNNFMAQFLADMLNRSVEIPKVTETTAWGAACLAGLQTGLFKNTDDIAAGWVADRCFKPRMSAQKRQDLYKGWKKAIRQVLSTLG